MYFNTVQKMMGWDKVSNNCEVIFLIHSYYKNKTYLVSYLKFNELSNTLSVKSHINPVTFQSLSIHMKHICFYFTLSTVNHIVNWWCFFTLLLKKLKPSLWSTSSKFTGLHGFLLQACFCTIVLLYFSFGSFFLNLFYLSLFYDSLLDTLSAFLDIVKLFFK